MSIMELVERLNSTSNGIIYFTSPRWEKRVVALMDTGTLGLISVDYSADEGVVGNTADETEFGNRSGRFFNQPDELLQDDFVLSSFNEAKDYEQEYNAKWIA